MLRKLFTLEILFSFIDRLLNDCLHSQAAIRIVFTELEVEVADLSLSTILLFLVLDLPLHFGFGGVSLCRSWVFLEEIIQFRFWVTFCILLLEWTQIE